jgi:hypothetical protein
LVLIPWSAACMACVSHSRTPFASALNLVSNHCYADKSRMQWATIHAG